MSSFLPVQYAGDEAFEVLLREVRCPMPLHEIKPFFLGCHAATDMPRLDTILSALWGGEPPPFDGKDQLERFVGQLLALWNELARWVDTPTVPLTPPRPIANLTDLQDQATLRQAEVTAFLRGLAAGNTDPEQLSTPARQALGMLEEVCDLWAVYERIAGQQVTLSAETLAENVEGLRKLDRFVPTAMRTIAVEQRRARAEAMSGQAVRKGTKIGRNAPCPCGSGKKYKQCCGRN